MSKKIINKLVRDNIPAILEKNGKSFNTTPIDPAEHRPFLLNKLKEEVLEFEESFNDEELADVLEVINTFFEMGFFKKDEVELKQKRKRELNGSFSKMIELKWIEEPNVDKAGWETKSAPLDNEVADNLYRCVSKALFESNKTTTYKFGFFKAILDNIFEVDESNKLPYSKLITSLSRMYWDLINVHGIPQKVTHSDSGRSSIENCVFEFTNKDPLVKGVRFDSLDKCVQKEFSKATNEFIFKYVVGALAFSFDKKIYGFSNKEKAIWFNAKSLAFLRENKVLLDQLNYYEWLKMCEIILKKKGLEIEHLSMVLENVSKRTNLDSFKRELSMISDTGYCFYCGKKLGKSYPLDHVIPWSFIQNDNLWNLVPCCRTCNSSKSNSIPASGYLERLLERNKACDIFANVPLEEIAESAKHNGIKIWEPKQ